MLTDDEARELLHRAAATIEVDPAESLTPESPRTTGPVLVVAAAVVVLVAALAIGLTREGGSMPEPVTPPTGDPVETPHVLDNDQIPSVLGYDLDDARTLLEAKGLTVVARRQPEGCQPSGIVTGTEPSIGARFAPGDTVTVFVTSPRRVIDCVGEPPWQQIWDLIRFARGVSGPPALAASLTLSVDEGEPSTITRDQAADPDSWTLCDPDGECHSALAAIEQMATQTWTMNGEPYAQRPHVAVGRADRCPWTPSPPLGASIPQVRIWVEVPRDGVSLCPGTMVGLVIDPETGGLAQVSLDLPDELPEPPPEPTATQREVAGAFRAWARDEESPPPPFADEVELLVSDGPWETLTANQAADRDRWSMCSGVAPEQCAIDPIRVLREHSGRVAQSRTLASCGAPDPRRLPAHLADAVDDELIRLDQAEPRNCQVAFALELWITEQGLIRAVNVLP